MVQWGELFWGDGNRSFEVLSSNVKNGAIAIEEFQRFINESAQCESTYCKNLTRLQSQLIKIQHVGTFTPIWSLVRDLFDKISSTHLTTVNFYQELLRDIHNYQDIYQKKVKIHIQKDADITRSADLISHLNNSLNAVNKAKEQYYSIAYDYERAKRAGNNMFNTSSMSTSQDNSTPSLAQSALNSITARQIDRLEKKHRQAQDEYKLTIEKYNAIRNDYEKRFYDACTKFQDFEIDHIERMLVFSLNYSEILQRNNEQIRTAENEFNDKLKSFTGSDLLNAFVEQKKTGTDRPALLQFEEIDNLKSPMQLTNSNISDLAAISQDDIDQFESGVPSFQAHFSVSSPTAKTNEPTRALSPTASNPQSYSSSNNPTMSPPSTSMHPVATNNSMTRSVDSSGSNDPTSNPFDVKIRKPKFPGFFGSNRKDKNKKNDKKVSANTKSTKTPRTQVSRDESTAANSKNETNDFIIMTDNNDDYAQISLNKPSTPEPYGRSSPSSSTIDNRNRNSFPSSKISKSSSSSDTSDDDDNPMLKIGFTIKPKTESPEGEDDATRIMNAMRLIDQNISRGTPLKTQDMNKSVSSGQIGARILPPPPIPSRPATTIPNSEPSDNIDQSSVFPPNDEFNRSLSDSLHIRDNLSFPIDNKNTTSIVSTDDDTEVANSFPNDNKSTLFPILQLPPSLQQNRQQSKLTSINSSPIISTDPGQSPLTIGATDQVPLAIAFQETIHAMISGDNQENWKTRIIGEMLISFPASLLNLLIDPSRSSYALEFRLKNSDNIENITTKPSLIIQNESNYSFDMTELNTVLRNLQEKTPSSRFFNLNVINYEVKSSNTANIPIEITSQWTRTFDVISVNITYRFNSSILPESIRFNNDAVIFYTIITEGQQIKESSPTAEWSANEHKLWWKVPYVNNGSGTLSATVQVDAVENAGDQEQDQPLTTSSIVNAYFVSENALFSSIDFDLISRGYRISLLKKKILSGKYQSEPDQSEPIHLFRRAAISPLPTT